MTAVAFLASENAVLDQPPLLIAPVAEIEAQSRLTKEPTGIALLGLDRFPASAGALTKERVNGGAIRDPGPASANGANR